MEQQSQGSIMESDDGLDSSLEYLGWFPGSIVGVRYYRGQVNRNEMVTLRREPNNIYDRWAVRVDNVYGEQVGHLPRDLVTHLSPLIDSGKLSLEASLGHNVSNVYRLPITIDCFGRSADLPEINRALGHASCYLRHSQVSAGSASSDRRSSFNGDRSTPSKAPSVSSVRLSAEEVAKRLDTLFDTILISSSARSEQEPAQVVKTPLYPHQKEALAWMMEREDCEELPVFWEKVSQVPAAIKSKYIHTLANFVTENRPPVFKGGILADDMGLGKTLTTISLIATQRFRTNVDSQHSACADDNFSKFQSIQHTTAGETKESFSRKRVVATTNTRSKKPKTKSAQGVQKVGVQVVAGSENNSPRRSGPTLILCPLSVLPVWQEQLDSHLDPGSLSVLTYYGSDRCTKAAFIKKHDVVLTTYGTLVSEANWSGTPTGLLAVEWLRIVADEAHIAKNPATMTAKTLHRLKAPIRWALTGTPLQNSLRDLRGLLMFLKVNPLDNVSLFQRIIERPVNDGDPEGLRRLKVLVNSLALRRTKATERKGIPLVVLPSKQVFLVTIDLESSALEKYRKWESAGRKLISQLLQSGTLLTHYTNVLEILLRLRQICCDPSLVSDEQTKNAFDSLTLRVNRGDSLSWQSFTEEERQRLIGLLRAGMDDECPVCLSEILDPCITACAHVFCKGCIYKVLKLDKAMCPLCRGLISSSSQLLTLPPEAEKEEVNLANPTTQASTSSTVPPSQKTQALIARLHQYWSAAPEEKHVIFSQFTGMLDRVGAALESEGIQYYRLDGKTPVQRRSEIVQAFSTNSAEHGSEHGSEHGRLNGPRVLMLSLKVGGVGLNLTAANHAHILDPWWNPSIEEQAADRIHRLGQCRPVHVHRYIVKDSIEERMLDLQEQKRELMKMAFDMARRRAEDVRAMTVRDIRRLMNIESDS